MKKLRVLGLLVVLLALSLSFIACGGGAGTGITDGGGEGGNEGGGGVSSGGGGNRGGGGSVNNITPPQPNLEVLTFTNGEYTIEITRKLNNSRAVAYQPKDGDNYKVYQGGTLISEGTVTIGTPTDTGAITLIFAPYNPPANNPDYTFTATLENGLLEIDGGSIKDKDDNDYTITTLVDKNKEYGIAKTKPILDEKNYTIAGITYSAFEKGNHTSSNEGTHYLISETYAAAKAELISAWGKPNFDSDEYPDIQYGIAGWTDIASDLMNGKAGVLFVVRNNEYISSNGSHSTSTDYRLAVWVSVEIGDMDAGSWKVASWDGPWTEDNEYKGDGVGVIAQTGNTIGGLAYAKKENFKNSGTYEWTNYILDSTYNAALAKLVVLWDDPSIGWMLFSGGKITNNAFAANGVVFEIANANGEDEDGQWTWTDYRLAKADSSNIFLWNAVRWGYSPDHE